MVKAALRAALAVAAIALLATGHPLLALAALIAIGVVTVVGLILFLALPDDPIGDLVALDLTGAGADTILGGADKGFLDPLRFDGGDRGGIYEAVLTLNRG